MSDSKVDREYEVSVRVKTRELAIPDRVLDEALAAASAAVMDRLGWVSSPGTARLAGKSWRLEHELEVFVV